MDLWLAREKFLVQTGFDTIYLNVWVTFLELWLARVDYLFGEREKLTNRVLFSLAMLVVLYTDYLLTPKSMVSCCLGQMVCYNCFCIGRQL